MKSKTTYLGLIIFFLLPVIIHKQAKKEALKHRKRLI